MFEGDSADTCAGIFFSSVYGGPSRGSRLRRLGDETKLPTISEYDCYVKMKAAKKPKSVIPGDLPNTIVKEFNEELAQPVSELLNNISHSAVWPKQYKVEHVTPIGKIPLPQSEDDLRPISLTDFFSKIMEQFLVAWLLEIIGHNMDFS